MSSDFSNTENVAFEDGELVQSADMLSEAQAARNRSQEILAAVLGVMNALPAMDPLQITANGSFQVTVGGANQRVFVEGNWCDNCPATQLQCPGSGPAQRTDSIAIQATPQVPDGDTITREVEAIDGSKTDQVIPLDANTITLQYVEGSETPPAGYVELARITVPANATGITQADITMIFPDVRKCITGTDSSPVTSLNGVGGSVLLAGKGAATVAVDSGNPEQIDITVPETVINNQNGPIFTFQGDGQVTVTEPEAGTIQINAPPAQAQTSVNGKSGSVVIEGGGVAAVTSQDAQTIKINVPAPPAAATINGDGPEAFTLEDGNGVHVRRVSSGTFAFDNEGVTTLNGYAGALELDFSTDFEVTDGATTSVALKNPPPRSMPFTVTFLAGGGYARPGNGTNWGKSLSLDGSIKIGADTVYGEPFSIGYRTILTLAAGANITFHALGVASVGVYVNGAFVGNAGGNSNSVGANLPAGEVTVDLVYNPTSMGLPYYLGSEGGSNPYGGSLTLFGWAPIDSNNNISEAVITAMQPG